MLTASGGTWHKDELKKVSFIIFSFIVYTILFFLLIPSAGEKVSVLCLIPIAAFSYLYGLKTGIITAILLIPINTLFFQLNGYPALTVMITNIPGIIGTFLVGGILGYTSDLQKKSKDNLAELTEKKITLESEINERKKIETALLESENKYRELINNIKEVIFQTDEEGNWIFLSPVWEEISGYTIQESLNKNFLSYVYPEDRGSIEKSIFLLVKSSKNLKVFETRFLTKRGEKKWARISMQPNISPEGNLISVSGTISDVTAQKIIEEKISIRDKALNAALSGIVITDPKLPDNPVIYTNPAFENITGYRNSEIIGRSYDFHFGPGTSQETVEKIKDALRNKKNCNAVLLCFKKDGTSFWNDLSLSPIKDTSGNVIYFLTVHSDVTERINAESALRKSEEKYRMVVENIKEVIFQTDKLYKFTYLNSAWYEITGFSVEESVGKDLHDYIFPDDKEMNLNAFKKLNNSEEKFCRHTLRFITKNSGNKWIEIFIRLIIGNDNEILGNTGTLVDVTERIKADEDIKQSLEKERELNELKSKFVSTISHEFRTPLTSILASSELVQRYYYKWDDEKKLNNLKRIEKSVEYMNELINDVLTINRADSGNFHFKPADFNLIDLSNDIMEEVKLSALNSHELIFDYDESCKNIYADEKLIRNIITNLLSNSVKYSPCGGRIDFRVKADSGKVEIIVKDEGIGISEEDQKKLFQPFFRGSNIENISGSGLGLSILQRAVQMHKGTIHLESRLGKGTNFTITIPVKINEENFSY